jgi:hypothetical protein
MKISNKVLFVIGTILSIYFAFKYQEEIMILLIPIVIIIKAKAIYYISLIMSKTTAFMSVSKTKLMFFLKTLTFYKAIMLGIKRFLIDNYFSKWLANNVINPVKDPIINYMKFFLKLGWKTKLKRLAYFILPIIAITVIAQITGMLESVLIFAELKAVVIGFFKIFFIVVGKVGGYLFTGIIAILKNTWLASIIEIFALSWILTKLEKIPYIGKWIIKGIDDISNFIGGFFEIFVKIYNKYIYSHISLRIKEKMEKIGEFLLEFLEDTKHKNEMFLVKNFKNEYINENKFEEYHKDIDFSKIYNKNEIYMLINKKTKDNIDIKYYFNVDVNSIRRDVLIIESVASCNKTGNDSSIINKNSFWVLNLSDEIITIKSLKNHFFTREIKPKKMRLIHSIEQDFDSIIVEYKNEILKANKVYEIKK